MSCVQGSYQVLHDIQRGRRSVIFVRRFSQVGRSHYPRAVGGDARVSLLHEVQSLHLGIKAEFRNGCSEHCVHSSAGPGLQPARHTNHTHSPSIHLSNPSSSFFPSPVCLFFLSFSLFLPSIMELNCVRELLCRLFSHSVTATVIVCVLRPGVVFARVCFFASEVSDLALCAICCRHAHSPMIGSFCA